MASCQCNNGKLLVFAKKQQNPNVRAKLFSYLSLGHVIVMETDILSKIQANYICIPNVLFFLQYANYPFRTHENLTINCLFVDNQIARSTKQYIVLESPWVDGKIKRNNQGSSIFLFGVIKHLHSLVTHTVYVCTMFLKHQKVQGYLIFCLTITINQFYG